MDAPPMLGDRQPDPVRLLATLTALLAIEALDLTAALNEACQRVADALAADKVDAFLHDPAADTLVAIGTSPTPMGRRQHAIGMHRLPLANGGREAAVYLSGESYATGRAEQDPQQLRGVVEGLGVRSTLIVPLAVGSGRRGVLLAASGQPDLFGPDDLAFLAAVARWVGMVAHRAELVAQLTTDAREQGRQGAADELLATLAHDLGNLLASVKGRLQLLQRRAIREERARDAADGAAALAAVERVIALMRDLLDSSRLEQGLFALERQPDDLAELVRATAAALATPETAIAVDTPDEVLVVMDASRIRQALENLLVNACKHAPGAPIHVGVTTAASPTGANAVVTVADQGPGIPPAARARLFERFARGPGSGGLGLGLYLASRIVAAHGGQLTLDPQPTIGATFHLSLPLDDAAAADTAGAAAGLQTIRVAESGGQADAPPARRGREHPGV
jgi:two-component system, OmpR family, sensor kinase